MTITKITYMQTFPTGSFANIKLGAEAEVGLREDVTQAMIELKKVVNDAFQAINPEFRIDYSTIPGHPSYSTPDRIDKSEEQITREQQIEGLYEIIRLSKTKTQLDRQKGAVERANDEKLTAAFNDKINTLQ